MLLYMINIREMQIKTTMGYNLTSVRMAIIKETRNNKLVRIWRKKNTCALLVGMQISAASIENSMEVPQKIKNRTTISSSNSASGY